MNFETLNINAVERALSLLFGAEGVEIIKKLYAVIDNAQNEAFAAGYKMGQDERQARAEDDALQAYGDGYDSGYDIGYAEALDDDVDKYLEDLEEAAAQEALEQMYGYWSDDKTFEETPKPRVRELNSADLAAAFARQDAAEGWDVIG